VLSLRPPCEGIDGARPRFFPLHSYRSKPGRCLTPFLLEGGANANAYRRHRGGAG
jgi:hypothetical protein